MMTRYFSFVTALLFSFPLSAGLLTGSDRMLCVPGDVMHCVAADGCSSELPEEENVPKFIEIDLKREVLQTTRASEENRSTPIGTRLRQNGYLYLQGVENGRSFSMVISEATGDLTFTVAADGETASMFGSCTPN